MEKVLDLPKGKLRFTKILAQRGLGSKICVPQLAEQYLPKEASFHEDPEIDVFSIENKTKSLHLNFHLFIPFLIIY